MEQGHDATEVLEFEYAVRAYPPRKPGAYWRLRWEEERKRKETTATSRAQAVAKATEIVERLASGVGTEVANARGAELVGHFLDPRRRPSRVKEWSDRMREEQERYCTKYVLPVIGEIRCRELGRADLQRVLDQAGTASVARQLRRTLTGLVNAGLIEGYLLPRQDVLRGVRWPPPDGAATSTTASTRPRQRSQPNSA